MLPADVAQALAPHLDGPIRSHSPVGGGCIANACRIETDDGAYFLKWSRAAAARTFPAEAAGLAALKAAASPLVVPGVKAVRAAGADGPGFLLMDWIETGSAGPGFWEQFGRGLAALHRHTATRYGFDGSNFIGRLPQRNTWEETWTVFFRAHRLEPQVGRAREGGRWEQRWDRPLENLYDRLDVLLPVRPPASLLHGDLWSGNFLVTDSGPAALVDPAAYFGHREADLALTELFGGYDARFYEAYRESWPLEPGYEARRDVYNLYHLINHLNHFGSGYAASVGAILRAYA